MIQIHKEMRVSEHITALIRNFTIKTQQKWDYIKRVNRLPYPVMHHPDCILYFWGIHNALGVGRFARECFNSWRLKRWRRIRHIQWTVLQNSILWIKNRLFNYVNVFWSVPRTRVATGKTDWTSSRLYTMWKDRRARSGLRTRLRHRIKESTG